MAQHGHWTGMVAAKRVRCSGEASDAGDETSGAPIGAYSTPIETS